METIEIWQIFMVGERGVTADKRRPFKMDELDPHVQHFIRKCVVAVAICVIKNKPDGVTAAEFCRRIQNGIKQEEEAGQMTHDLDPSLHETFESLFTRKSAISPVPNESAVMFDSDSTGSNLKLIQAIGEIKSIVYSATEERAVNRTLLFNSQDSGYSTMIISNRKSSNEGYIIEKKLNKLDDSLRVIVDFLIRTREDPSRNDLVYVSDFFGEIVDVLYDQNISLNSINGLPDIIEETIGDILNNSNLYMDENEKWIARLGFFHIINKTIVLMKHSFKILSQRLEEFREKLNKTDAIIECENPDDLNRLYFTFQLVEDLLSTYNTKKAERLSKRDKKNDSKETEEPNTLFSQNWSLSERNNDNGHRLFEDLDDGLMNVLNRLVFDCAESYPLVSFWAMECIKVKNLESQVDVT